MATTLLTTGLLCVIAAIVGGGIEALGGKVPVIESSKRQTALGLFGIVLLLGAWFSSSSPKVGPNEGSKASSRFDTAAGASATPEPNELRALPASELSKLELVSMTFNGPDGLALTVYNGTTWTLKEVTVHVRLVQQVYGTFVFVGNVSFPLDTITPGRDVGDATGEPFKKSDYIRKDALVNRVRVVPSAYVVEKAIVGATGIKTLANMR